MAKNKTPAKKTPASKPNEDPNEDPSEDEDEDEDEDTAEEENRRINAIVTSRVKREMKAVNTTLAAIQESIKSLATAKPKQDPDEDDEDDDQVTETKPAKGAEMDIKTSRKLTKLERELADEREARKKAEKDRSEEQERAKRNEMRSLFQQALADHGVTDPKLQRAALNLLEEDGYMVRDDDGKPKFKGTDKYGIETLFDPKAGLKSWVLNEGKSFVPAVDAGGSGAGAARAHSGQSQNLTKGEYGKLTEAQKASIELERASQGLPQLD